MYGVKLFRLVSYFGGLGRRSGGNHEDVVEVEEDRSSSPAPR
jgi:hypothetical protein